MKFALVLSILVKGVGALLEIANQVIITRFGGVDVFGEYNFYVSIIEIMCWLFFSGIVKTNAYYVANGWDISRFRRRFFLLYALPVVVAASALGSFYSPLMLAVMAGGFLYGTQMNLSSVFLAVGRYKVSLFGEYLVSRLVIFVGAVALAAAGMLGPEVLAVLYAAGFLASVLYFTCRRHELPASERALDKSEGANLVRKQVRFQLTDVANGLINQAPVIIQYLFAGAFQAGVLSVVLVTRKVISFIAGPTAKVYLPEFACCYGAGDMAGLRKTYREIVLLQMCFILPICLVVVGAPDALLALYNSQLVEYSFWMRAAAIVFMVMVLFGPQGNLLSMVGREGVEMWSKWASLAAMVAVMAITFGDPMFVFYGIAAQVIVDALTKLFFLVKVLNGLPIGIADWLKLGVPFAALTAVSAWVPLGVVARFAVACLLALLLCVVLAMLFFREPIAARLKGGRSHG